MKSLTFANSDHHEQPSAQVSVIDDRVRYVVGPLGEKLTLNDLPAVDTVRWTIRRKAEIVAAVEGGLLSFDDACARYKLAMEELTGWRQAMLRTGMAGLRVTRSQAYRATYQRHY